MQIISFPFLCSEFEKEFLQIFIDTYIQESSTIEGHNIIVSENDFYHAFYEKGKGNIEKQNFSLRRARRILILKAICKKKVPYKLFWQVNREPKTVCLLCEEIDTQIILKPISTRRRKYFRLLTVIVLNSNISKRISKLETEAKMLKEIGEVF